MIFSKFSVGKILSGEKTQTRRLLKEGESLVSMRKNKRVLQVISVKGAIKWQVGGAYVVQSGRGARGTGLKIKILDLRGESLFCINEKQARAEGFEDEQQFLYAFYKLNWSKVPRKEKECCGGDPACCEWNPLVWVIEFKRAR